MSRARWPRKHGARISCEAEVELDVDEVLEQLSDADLIEEMEHRKIQSTERWEERNAPTIAELERIADCLRRGWHQEALQRCERMLDAVMRANVPLARMPELKARWGDGSAKGTSA